MKRKPRGKYIGVVKRDYDQLWHAIWIDHMRQEDYDRVTKEEAQEIASKIFGE